MVCVCLHALLATTAQPAKLAIYWKGENVATNGTAAAAVRSRGFTHAVVAHLDSAAALGGRAALVCGARKDQTTFAERFAMCDGAMEWYPGGFSADPGFYVPSAVNRRGGV